MGSPPPESRPGERLRRHGAVALSEFELVALVLGGGGQVATAFALAERVMASTDGSLARLARADAGQLEGIPGIGPSGAARIVAAVELGKRVVSAREPRGLPISGPRDVLRYVHAHVADLAHEEFHVVLLNAQNVPMLTRQVTRGILDASLIHPREVFRDAIVHRAASLVLVHNHPSGDPEPSREDVTVTRLLMRAGDELGIPVVDHVIVAGRSFVSLAARRLLRPGAEAERTPWHVRDPLQACCYEEADSGSAAASCMCRNEAGFPA